MVLLCWYSNNGVNEMETYIIGSTNMEKLKKALGYRPNFRNGNSVDVQVNLTDSEYDRVVSELSGDRYFRIFRYSINNFCC